MIVIDFVDSDSGDSIEEEYRDIRLKSFSSHFHLKQNLSYRFYSRDAKPVTAH